MNDNASNISNSSESEILGQMVSIKIPGELQAEERLFNLQFNRNDIGFNKLNKTNKESTKSIILNRAATDDELKV